MTENVTSFNTTSVLCSTCPWNFWVVLILVLGLLNWMLTLPSGLWVVWLQTLGSRVSLENQIFMLNLYCTDQVSVLVCLLSCFSYIAFPLNQWIRFLLFFSKLNLLSQPVFQCCVCVEHYLAVVRPVLYLTLRPHRCKQAGLLLLLWMVALVFRLVEHFLSTTFPLMAVLLLVVSVQLFCNLSVLAALKRPGPGDGWGGQEDTGGKCGGIKRRAFVVISLMQAKLLLNYLPMFAIASIKHLIHDQVLRGHLQIIFTNVCFLGTFVQPLLYLRRAGKI